MNEVTTLELTDDKIDDVCEMIVEGTHYKEIALKYKCSTYKLFCFLHSEKHSARAREAREMAAYILADEAERVLAMAKDNPALLAVARDLAHHYRWKASKINGKQFADRKVYINDDSPKDQEADQLTITVKYDEEGSNDLSA